MPWFPIRPGDGIGAIQEGPAHVEKSEDKEFEIESKEFRVWGLIDFDDSWRKSSLNRFPAGRFMEPGNPFANERQLEIRWSDRCRGGPEHRTIHPER